jgi:8-oxo-dGTP diphosphatase
MEIETDYPTVAWEPLQATFLPVGVPCPITATVYAAVVFACMEGQLVLADIEGRGWCIPGGRLEPGETAEAAARREAYEEAGLTLGPLRLLGHYLLQDASGNQQLVPTYVAAVTDRAQPPESESRGVSVIDWEELPTCYYRWDALLAAVCDLAQQQCAP